jgi:tetratricopeptide (TPR) repeat protein
VPPRVAAPARRLTGPSGDHDEAIIRLLAHYADEATAHLRHPPASAAAESTTRWFLANEATLYALTCGWTSEHHPLPAAATRHLIRLAQSLGIWYAQCPTWPNESAGTLARWRQVCLAILDLPPTIHKSAPAWAHNHLGIVERHAGKPDNAQHHFTEAASIRPRRPREGGAQLATNRGIASLQQGEADALRLLSRGVALRPRRDHRGRAIAELALAAGYLATGHTDPAESHLTRAEKLFDDLADQAGLGATHSNLALLYATQGRWWAAHERLDAAEQCYNNIHDPAGLQRCHHNRTAIKQAEQPTHQGNDDTTRDNSPGAGSRQQIPDRLTI